MSSESPCGQRTSRTVRAPPRASAKTQVRVLHAAGPACCQVLAAPPIRAAQRLGRTGVRLAGRSKDDLEKTIWDLSDRLSQLIYSSDRTLYSKLLAPAQSYTITFDLQFGIIMLEIEIFSIWTLHSVEPATMANGGGVACIHETPVCLCATCPCRYRHRFRHGDDVITPMLHYALAAATGPENPARALGLRVERVSRRVCRSLHL